MAMNSTFGLAELSAANKDVGSKAKIRMVRSERIERIIGEDLGRCSEIEANWSCLPNFIPAKGSWESGSRM